MRVLVVGAGVTGLTCAVVAAERGHQVDVLARDLPQETTSAIAAACWHPPLVHPADRVLEWSRRTYEVMAALPGSSGVRRRRSTELVADPASRPWWADAVPSLHTLAEVPEGFGAGWAFDGLVAHMPTYLDYLVRRLAENGGTLTRMALPALPRGADVVVNASGLGSRLLAADPTTVPIRGHVVRLAPVPGVDDVLLADGPSGLTYVVPRGEDVVVGGTSELDVWDLAPRDADTAAILARAGALVPQLQGAPVLGVRVGLRPARPSVRVEREERDGASPVVHCYGHGGAGVTLSWGCAREVVDLAESAG
ncbi:FAD-binding oxidoreductase [Mumia sp. zg.B53]|uniref:FAD-dependent oxidoreductase n=1 Tax=Mumia sp. zg.B53 TaxID=2855449 RepID=UPI001C6EE615|nr:FAD-dependent oxidoreductase [Mumia sp. zg.B53]MBW9215694.1 FAD-binding oxidoreductase [Mumia sp. zg.B53]